jgi:hypothetical protein
MDQVLASEVGNVNDLAELAGFGSLRNMPNLVL